jgi:hypothetical protein
MDADPQAEISASLLICFGFDFFAFVVSARDGWRQRRLSVCSDVLFGLAGACSTQEPRAPAMCRRAPEPGKGDRQGRVGCTE